jgi:hypothetical protein
MPPFREVVEAPGQTSVYCGGTPFSLRG